MTWWEAVGLALAIITAWALLPVVVDLLDKAFQRRMAATLWRSLPYDPGPWTRREEANKAAAASARMAELEAALATPDEARGAARGDAA